ncbi:MAG TPA: ABC transporter substrate-binding protein [Stellaceae bacterium]|nr:ABC transporter substrate-binding protein [Stellaceae bacterium]
MRTLGVVAALALALAGAGAVAQEPARVAVKVGVTGRPDQAALELAFHRGYFAKQGLDVEFVGGGVGGEEYVSSLATNQIQVDAGAPNAALFNAFNRGIDLRIVADWAHVGDAKDSTFSMVGRGDLQRSGALKSAADLKGKSVGVGPSRGSYNEMFVAELLAAVGLGVGDIEAQHISFPDGLAALSGKTVAATLLIEPLVMMAHDRGIGDVLVTAGAVDPGAQVAVVMYSAVFARNRDAATRYMVAYLQGVRDFIDAFDGDQNKEAAIDVMVAALTLKDRAVWEKMPAHDVDPNGSVNLAHIKKEAAFYKEQGTLTGALPDLDKFVDPSFAEAAVKILGRR